jgi:tetratricopeptide (TPR) repeat protein
VPKRRSPHTTAFATDLPGRVERALSEGRSKQALELAKVLFHQEPTPEHRELVRRAYLDRGRELRERGAGRDSLIVLKAAADSQGDDPAWLVRLAEQLILSGGIAEALALLTRVTDDAAKDRLLGPIADAALRQGGAGRALLPEAAWQADFDRVVQAFALSEAGQDDAAREVLAGLGLRSPFLEWKLLIRGLLAYYAGDDVRALENWQRLSNDRLPAHLAAPLRQAIDPAFRAAQPAASQAALKQQFDRLQGAPLATQLRGLLAALSDNENLAPAFRQAEALLPELRRTAPALAERLARVFYWAITETGPDDVARYQRVFGKPTLDPRFSRLRGLAYDRGGELHGAHEHWQKYEQDVAADPSHWPDGQAARARALVWMHMGRNAAKIPGAAKMARMPRHLRDLPGARQLRPSAEQCFQRAAELAPDLLEPYQALFDYHRAEGHDEKAAAAARRLLNHFPDHVPTLEALGDLSTHNDEQAEALALYKRALSGNPLDRRLRSKVMAAHLGCARILATAKSFEPARQEIQAALALEGGVADLVLLCRAAAVELKAGDEARAEDLLTQARQRGPGELVSYRMLTEVARLKLPKSLKTRFEGEFAAVLTGPPSGAVAARLLDTTAALSEAAPYVGQKTHQKKVLTYLERAKKADFAEDELKLTCTALLHLEAVRLAQYYVNRGRDEFPKNPHFPYLAAMLHFRKGREDLHVWAVRPLLQEAERLARALPPTPELKKMLDDVGARLQALGALNPFGTGFFEDFFGFDDEDDEDDDF